MYIYIYLCVISHIFKRIKNSIVTHITIEFYRVIFSPSIFCCLLLLQLVFEEEEKDNNFFTRFVSFSPILKLLNIYNRIYI